MEMIFGQILALFTAGCWAHNSIVYSEAGKRVGSSTVTHIRLWVALPAMAIVHFFFIGNLFPTGQDLSLYLFLGLSGFFGFFVADLFIFRGFVDAGPRETMVVMTLGPIFSTLLSWIFLKETLTLLEITGISATVGGVIWVVLEEGAHGRGKEGAEREAHSKKVKGALFALAGAFTQAVGMLFAKAGLVSGLHPVSGNMIRISAGLVGLIIYTLVRGQFVKDFKKMADTKSLLLIGSGALVGPVMGMAFSLTALSLAPVGIVTALMQTTPIWLLPIDHFFFKKRITRGAVAGTFVAIGGTVLLFL
jgi:drug/metabolite transporter (DMT)-like permease